MPEFWEFPTVSMGLGPIMAIYQARFIRYLEDRGLIAPSDQKVWAFLGDGETDEPESLGAISLAAREKLDNLIFVINCNLQRLDGPVRGNGQIIQELEANFRGNGWNVIKVIWGSDWDPCSAADTRRACWSSAWANAWTASSRSIPPRRRLHPPALLRQVSRDAEAGRTPVRRATHRMRMGGHDPEKVYAAYRAAVNHEGAPTVILARTIKGYGLGEAGEGKNITHQQKKLNEDEAAAVPPPLRHSDLRGRHRQRPVLPAGQGQHGGPVPAGTPRALGGFLPKRIDRVEKINAPGTTPCSRSSSRARKAARCPPPWPSCAC
jgi:pyruvate dehydrogenase E1 component